MLSDKILKYSEILFTIWVILFGLAGILAVGIDDGKNIPPTAFGLVVVMALCVYIVHLIRKERKRRDREAFYEKHPELRRLYI